MVKPTVCPSCGGAVQGYAEETQPVPRRPVHRQAYSTPGDVTTTLYPCGCTFPGVVTDPDPIRLPSEFARWTSQDMQG